MSLILFLDALPYSYFEKYRHNFDMNFPLHFSEHIPSLGFSSNLHWEIFANLVPDKLGFFTDWNISSQFLDSKFPPQNKFIHNLYKSLEKFPVVTFSIRYTLNKIRGHSIGNIPFHIKPFFNNTAVYLLSDQNLMKKHSPFKNHLFLLQDELDTSEDKILALIQASIHKGYNNIFAALSFPDKLGHIFGRSEAYDQIINTKMERILEIVSEYLSLNQSENFIIFSDHGMSNVEEKINLRLEQHFGQQAEDTYIYFYDSILLRIWCLKPELLPNITNFLQGLSYGTILDDDIRKQYNISKKEFGDIIFILKEGRVFSPNYFGIGLRKKGNKGMHGYLPQSKDQSGLIITNTQVEAKYSSHDMYELLKSFL